MRKRGVQKCLRYVLLLPVAYFCLVGILVTFSGRDIPSSEDAGHRSLEDKPGLRRTKGPMGQDDDPPVLEAPDREENQRDAVEHKIKDIEFRYREDEMRRQREREEKEQKGKANQFMDMLKPNKHKSKPAIHDEAHLVKKEEVRSGPGENGVGIDIKKEELSPEDRKKFDEGWQKNAFNQYASDMMSLHRSLPDIRPDDCKKIIYPHDMPDTSVIVIFHNEAWSVLLRTVHSVIDRSPPNLLHEVILVDDFSDLDHLQDPLQNYVNHNVSKVRLVRAKKREGLIRARLLGASVAKGDILLFLDSHCESTPGWLEPIVFHISKSRKNVVTPLIDVIDDATLRYAHNGPSAISVGGFDWNMQFNWHALPNKERSKHKSLAEPVRSPTMAGGLFAIDRSYFEEIGTYDPGMDIWGGENLELSFRVWMCGGSLETHPCSHVGHIFRKRSPYSWKSGTNVVKKNSVRVAEVWMDEYKKYYYERLNYDLGDYGDISSRVELRKRLNCTTFKWFVENIFPELFIPGDAVASGEIANKVPRSNGQPMCLDSPVDTRSMQKPIKMWPCHKQGGNQFWMFSKEGEIRRDEGCMDYAGQFLMIYQCHGMKGNQEWIYGQDNTLRHRNTNLCMELSQEGDKIEMKPCTGIDRQLWLWKRKS